MKHLKIILKKIIVIFTIFFILISSISSSFAQKFDDSAREYLRQQTENFINQHAGNSVYSTSGEHLPANFVGETFYSCCTSGIQYVYQVFLGIDITQLGFSYLAVTNLSSLRNEHWTEVPLSSAKPGDILVRDGHAEMVASNGGATHFNFGSGRTNANLNIHPGNDSFTAVFSLNSDTEVTPSGDVPVTTLDREDNLIEDPDDKFYYQGIPDGTYTGAKSALNWIFNLLSQLIDFVAGLLTLIIRMVFIGYANIIVNIITTAVNDLTGEAVEQPEEEAGITDAPDATSSERLLDNNSYYTPTSTELQPEGDDQLTIDKIILGEVPLLDVNFFSDTAGGLQLKEDGSLAILRENIAGWYYIIRNISIIIMLLILIYLGIRLAISTVASEQAQYKRLLVNWLVGFFIIFFINYYILFVLQLNETLIDWIKDAFTAEETIEESSIYETVRTKAYEVKLSSGMAGTILYLVLVVLMLKYFYIYLKRLLALAILTIMAPAMGGIYAFSKISTGKSTAFTAWMKDYTLLVLVQSVHALVYLCFVKAIIQLTQESLVGIFIAFVVLNFMLKASNIFFDIFSMIGTNGPGRRSTLKTIINSDARSEILDKVFIAQVLFGGTKSIISGTYHAGKNLIFGTSLTPTNAKKKAQARSYGLNNISHKNIDVATGRILPGAKAKKNLSSRVFRRNSEKQLSNDLGNRMKEEYFKSFKTTKDVVATAFKVPLRGAANAAKLATAVPLMVAGHSSLAFSNIASATGSMIAAHESRRQIRGIRKENARAKKEAKKQNRKEKYEAMSKPKKVAYNISRATLAVPVAAGKLITAPIRGVAGTVQDTITAEQGDINYVQTKAPAKLQRIKEARRLENRIVNKYNQNMQDAIRIMKAQNANRGPLAAKNEKFVETLARNKFNNQFEESVNRVFRVSDKVDAFAKNIGNSQFKKDDVSGLLNSMKDYMKQNIKENDGSLTDKQIESKIRKIQTQVVSKFDKQKGSSGTLGSDKLKNIIEDTLESNNANEKAPTFERNIESKVDIFAKKIRKTDLGERDISSVLDSMKDYMKKNIKENDSSLSEAQIEGKIAQISTDVAEQYDREKTTTETVSKDKLKSMLEKVLKRNDADEKAPSFTERIEDRVETITKDIGKSDFEERDISSVLDSMKDYMRKNIKENDSSLSEEQIEEKMAQIQIDVSEDFDKQKDSLGKLSKDKLKSILEDRLQRNNADEKAPSFTKSIEDKVETITQDIGKSDLEERDISSVLDSMKDYMKQNLKKNNSGLTDEQVEEKITQIRTDITESFDIQKKTSSTLSKDKLKTILEGALKRNDADEKETALVKDLEQDMRALQRTDRNFNIHFGSKKDNYLYRREETGESNLKNVLNSLTFLKR